MRTAVRNGILGMILFGAASWCGADSVVAVVVAGQRAQGAPAAMVVGGTVCGPLEACAKLAGAQVSWDAAAGVLRATGAEGQALRGSVGGNTITVDGRTLALGGTLQNRQGACWGPVKPVLEALGCVVHWKPGATTLTANGVLRSVEVRAGASGAKVALRTSVPTSGALEQMDGPARRLVDLRGVEAPSGLSGTRYIYTGPLVRVRLGQPKGTPAPTRVVADLQGAAAAAWWPAEDGRGGVLVLGDPTGQLAVVERHLPRVEELTTSQTGLGTERFRVAVDWPVKPDWDILAKPPRIRISLPEVEAGIRDTNLPMSGEFVDHVEVSQQRTPPCTTLDVHLRELVQCELNTIPTGGGEVVFRRERLRDKTVVLDPGHGGKDNGASGRVLREKDINLDVATRTASKLQALGARALLTRPDDRFVELADRPRLAKQMGGDLFVSVHCNAMPRRNEGHGTETFYHFLESKCLGLIMQSSLVQSLQRADRGTKFARFYVIRGNELPAVLVELMFLNDDREEALLQQEATRDTAAGAIAEGLRQYVEGTGTVAERLEGGAGLMRLP